MKQILTHSENIKNFSNVSQHVIFEAETRDAGKTLTYVTQEGSHNANGKRGRQSKKGKRGQASTSTPKEGKMKKRKRGKRGGKKDLSKVKCFNCQQKGHFARDCTETKKVLSESFSQLYVSSHVMVAHSQPMWFVDTGATKHVARDREGFVDYHRIPVGSKHIFMGNNSSEEVLGVAGNDMSSIVATKQWLSSTFEMKDMGEANYVLGVKIVRDRSKRLLGGAISWCRKKKSCIALSTMESEYVACSAAVQEVVWLRSFIQALGVTAHIYEAVAVHCENTAALDFVKDPKYHEKAKHIGLRYHFIRTLVAQGEVSMKHIPTARMMADLLTKPIARDVMREEKSCSNAAKVSPPMNDNAVPMGAHKKYSSLTRVEADLARARAAIQQSLWKNQAYDIDYIPAGPVYRNSVKFQ
ncbi:hypothetical protein RJ640_000367, partial [Escallonia rubra]